MLRGSATVLGDAASDIELFLTDDLVTRWANSCMCSQAGTHLLLFSDR